MLFMVCINFLKKDLIEIQISIRVDSYLAAVRPNQIAAESEQIGILRLGATTNQTNRQGDEFKATQNSHVTV